MLYMKGMVDPRQILVDRAQVAGQVALAKELGVSLTYINDVIRGIRAPGPKILRALGIEREVRYKRVSID